MKRLRILHCAYSGLGGHAAVLFTLLNERTRDDFDHFVIFFGVEALCDDYARECRRLGIPFVFVQKRSRIGLSSYARVLSAIRTTRPDLVVINGTSLSVPLLAARSLLRQQWPVIVRETHANHLKTRFDWLGSRISAQLADAVIYLTEEYKREVDMRLKLSPTRDQAVVIANGVDTDAFRPAAVSHSGPLTLTMVSRLVPIKDHASLIEALRILVLDRGYKDLTLQIAGDGPLRGALERHAIAAGLAANVSFAGLLTQRDVIALLARTDIYVHCTFGETMSNSILQAMAAQLPIVASDVDGVSNLIRHGHDGLLVPVGQPVALADALASLIRSPSDRRVIGLNARDTVLRTLSQRRMVEEYQRLFERVASPVAQDVGC